VSDKEKRPDRPDYDLTSPNVYPTRGEQPRRPAAPDDRTAVNRPVRPTTEMPSRAAPPNKYDLTSVNVRGVPFDEDEDARAPQQQPQPQPRYAPVAPPVIKPRSRVPAWLWVVGGAWLGLLRT
jgi:hypothetical protein